MFDYTDLTASWAYKKPVLARYLNGHADNSDICYQALKNDYAESISTGVVSLDSQFVPAQYVGTTEYYDSASQLTTTAYTVPADKAGLYLVHAIAIVLRNTVAAGVTIVMIYKNGVEVARGDKLSGFTAASGSTAVSVQVTALLNLEVGDVITVFVQYSSGTTTSNAGTLTTDASTSQSPVFMLTRLGGV